MISACQLTQFMSRFEKFKVDEVSSEDTENNICSNRRKGRNIILQICNCQKVSRNYLLVNMRMQPSRNHYRQQILKQALRNSTPNNKKQYQQAKQMAEKLQQQSRTAPINKCKEYNLHKQFSGDKDHLILREQPLNPKVKWIHFS